MTKSKEFIRELREQMEPKDQEHAPSGGYMFEYDPDTNHHNGDFNKVTAAVFNCNSVYVIRNDAIFLADNFGISNGKVVNLQCSGMGTMQFLETGGVYDD